MIPALLASIWRDLPPLRAGNVWLAGAGPGDPGQLSLAVLAALSQTDALVHDALVSPAVLDLAPQAERFSVGKRGGQPSWKQEDINTLLIRLAKQQRRVLRLKGGDPTMFGRGGEEALALAEAAIPFRFLPGLTAGIAALSACDIPATHRGINQAIVLATGHDAESEAALNWQALAQLDQPIVFYMALQRLPVIAAKLIGAGMAADTPAAAICAATLPEQRLVVARLGDLESQVKAAGLQPPGLLVVGRIVAMRDKLHRLLAGL